MRNDSKSLSEMGSQVLSDRTSSRVTAASGLESLKDIVESVEDEKERIGACRKCVKYE